MPHLWQRLPNAANARVNHQAVVLRDNVYIFGGYQKQFQGLDYPETTQIDVLCFCMSTSRWCRIAYPAVCKIWNCRTKAFSALPDDESTASPSLRFGHTVVPWRGRCWLFGGRSRFSACPSDLFLFDPNFNPSPSSSETAPFWARVEAIQGAPPNPRDGHASAVLEDAMFVFGGFNDQMETFENSVYRLDFITWQWQTISLGSGLLTQPPREVPQPSPRDFASLVAHRGRLFLFGGRSYASLQDDTEADGETSGVYESTLWELLPVASSQIPGAMHSPADEVMRVVDHSTQHICYRELIDHLTASYDIAHAAWEEATGNWESREPWHSAPPRPPCLWRHALEQSYGSEAPQPSAVRTAATGSPVMRKSVWASGIGVWRMLHPNTRSFECTDVLQRLHASGLLGDQEFRRHQSNLAPPSMLPYLLMCPPPTPGPLDLPSFPIPRDGPFGRRSMSSWAHNGNLYVAFGTLRSDALRFKVYFNDVWRFCLEAKQWFPVHYDSELTSTAGAAFGPSARRRAVAVLHLPPPGVRRGSRLPRVFVYGGTQPQRLNVTGVRSRAAGVTATCAGDTAAHSNGTGSKEPRALANPPTHSLLPLLFTDAATTASPSQPLGLMNSLILFVSIDDSRGSSSIASPAFHLFAVAPPTFLSDPLPTLLSRGGMLVFTSLADLLTNPSNLSSDLAFGAEPTSRENVIATSLLRTLQSNPPFSRSLEPNGDQCVFPALFTLLCESSNDGDHVNFTKPPALASTAAATAVCLRLVGRVAAELARQLPPPGEDRTPGPVDSIRVCLPLEEATLNSQSPSSTTAPSQRGSGSLQCCLRPSFFHVATSDLLMNFVQSVSSVTVQPLSSTSGISPPSSSSSSLSLADAGMESEEDDMSILSSSSSSSSSSNSCSSQERLDERCAYVPTVGHVLRGRENLKMLNDVYVLHLEASLYQLCLSRVRSLFPTLPNSGLQDLPDAVLNDLNSLY
ncbi:hypothetical protein AAHC03_020999 [Spirometra sp. Aus1]